MSDRTQDWLRTYTGKQFHLFDPRAEDICIEDIAHALSLICRYTGHVQRFYSVAEHSVLVCGVVGSRLRDQGIVGERALGIVKWALLHDAAEAYVGDMARPLKHQPEMALFRETEARIMEVISAKFGLVGGEPTIVRAVDTEIIGTEARGLKHGESLATVDPLPAMAPELRKGKLGVSPEKAEQAFLEMWDYCEQASYESTEGGMLKWPGPSA